MENTNRVYIARVELRSLFEECQARMGLHDVLHHRDQILRQYAWPLTSRDDTYEFARRVVVRTRQTEN